MWLGQFTATDLVFTAARQCLQSLAIKYNAFVLCEEGTCHSQCIGLAQWCVFIVFEQQLILHCGSYKISAQICLLLSL